MPRATRFFLAGLAALSSGGCFPVYKERMQFDTGRMSDDTWSRHRRECLYEAKKASASAHVNIAGYVAEELYILCLENRGATYKGKKKVRIE
jgi:hypothetical protein